jgi:hypothetical protein
MIELLNVKSLLPEKWGRGKMGTALYFFSNKNTGPGLGKRQRMWRNKMEKH